MKEHETRHTVPMKREDLPRLFDYYLEVAFGRSPVEALLEEGRALGLHRLPRRHEAIENLQILSEWKVKNKVKFYTNE